MTLAQGTRFGVYEILGPIGAGGMGEVYRARDTKLGRDVAIKILPPAFARDADRLMRFEREARTLASLNHPNIAQIYGHEQFGDFSALVLEFVDGPTLAERLRQRPIDIAEARQIVTQIGAALVAAHDLGVIHRDLKPANIKLRPDGVVKVLDFGLAKLVAANNEVPTNAATITSPATMRGEILGTAAYMSPEQARGLAVDKRTDVWAMGCVLFEILTGKPAFKGSTVTDVLAAVVREEPDWQSLPADLPDGFHRMLRRCLRKEPAVRLRDAADAVLELESEDRVGVARRAAPPRRVWVAAAAVLVIALAGIALNMNRRTAGVASRPVGRFTFRIPDVNRLGDSRIAISPDGSRIAYTAIGASSRALYLHDLNSETPRVVPGVSDPIDPFFSPDGEWVAVHSMGRLLRVNVSSLTTDEICVVEGGFRGGAWTSNGDAIVFAQRGRIRKVPATGGTPVDLIEVPGRSLQYPQLLPGDTGVLYAAGEGGAALGEIVVHNLETGESRVVERGDDARYVSTGDLVFIRNQTLYAAPFDANTLQLKGPVVRVLDGVQQTTAAGGIFAVSPASQLVYARSLEGNRRRLAMVDRRGNLTPLDLPPRNLQSPSISPDGRKIVFEDLDLPHSIWIFDVTTNALSKLAPPDNRHNPIWSWDGSRIVFQTNREGPGGGSVYWMRADGSGPEERLVAAKQANLNAVSWLPRGQGLAVVEVTNNDRNVMLYRLGSGGSLQPLLQTPAFESLAQFSPDGRWLAYVSNVSKRDEVYVRPFPGSGGLWQVSNDGGTQPLWSRDGRELFYRRGDTVMTVTVNATTVFASTRPRELFTNASLAFRANILDYDVFPDGQRFVMVEELNPSGSAQLHVVTEWFDELKRNRESRR